MTFAEQDIVLIDVNTRVVTPFMLELDQTFHPFWSPDGNRLAFYSSWSNGGPQIMVYDFPTDELTTLPFLPMGQYPQWNNDNDGIIMKRQQFADTATDDPTYTDSFFLLTLDGEIVELLPDDPRVVTYIAGQDRNYLVAPDGQRAVDVTSVPTGGYQLVRLEGDRAYPIINQRDYAPYGLPFVWAPNSRHAMWHENEVLWVLDTFTGDKHRIYTPQANEALFIGTWRP